MVVSFDRGVSEGSVKSRWLGYVVAGALVCAAPQLWAAAQSSTAKSTAKQALPTKNASAKTGTAKAPASPDDYKSIGQKSAPITMEVFSDYQCPSCRELYLQTLRPLIQDYVSTGKIYLIHRDMPLTAHQYSRVAARYVNAAAKLNKLEPAIEAVYQAQDRWAQDGNVEGALSKVLSPAEMKKARALVAGGTLEPSIDSDVALATKFHVASTPTSVITHNGQTYPIVGVMNYRMLRQFVDDLLKK